MGRDEEAATRESDDSPDADDGAQSTPDDEEPSNADVEPPNADVEPPNADDEHPDDHVLPPEKLQYPTFGLETGTVREDGGFEGNTDLDREGMRAWLEDLAGGLASHDVAVEGDDRRVTLGVAPEAADLAFEPDDDGTGELAVTFRLRAKPMTVADADDPQVGARGGKGFIPLSMLTGDRDTGAFRCYNWVDDPTGDDA